MRPPSDPDVRAAALAARQDGLLTLSQAVACGLSPEQVKRRLQSRRWRQLVRGVYVLAGAPETWRQRTRAAQLAVEGAGGVASHVSAGALHGVLRPSLLPHVTVPSSASARCPIAKVHRASLYGLDRATVDGIRTTSVSRLLVDMASVFDRPSLEELVDDVLVGGLASPGSTLGALDRVGGHRRGRLLLRSALEAWTTAIEPGSPAEMRLLRRLTEWGLPPPATQYVVERPDGSPAGRVDAAWPAAFVALEYEGVRHHAVRRAAPDELRYQAIEAIGWTVVPASKHDLLPGERRLPDLLGRLLGLAVAA